MCFADNAARLGTVRKKLWSGQSTIAFAESARRVARSMGKFLRTDPAPLHFAYIITYQKVHAGRACSPQQIIGRRPLLMISPWRPRRGSRLPAEKLLCARSLHQLCCTKSIRSLVLLGTQKGRVHCRSALAEPRRSFAITSPGSGLDQSAPRRDFCSRRPFSFVLVSLKIQRHT